MAEEVYDLAKIAFQIQGIDGLSRLTNGNLRATQINGQDRYNIVTNEAGSSAIEVSSTSIDIECSIEMPRDGQEFMAIQKILKEWAFGDDHVNEKISVSYRPTADTIISSNEAVVERVDWGDLSLSAKDQRVTFRLKMINCSVK